VGELTATTIYAWMGDVKRFLDAMTLAACADLVPSIRQSGEAVLPWLLLGISPNSPPQVLSNANSKFRLRRR